MIDFLNQTADTILSFIPWILYLGILLVFVGIYKLIMELGRLELQRK